MQFDAEAMDAAQFSAAEAADKHRPDLATILAGVRRPERLLVVTDSALEVADRAAPMDNVIIADRTQRHPMNRAWRDGTIEFEI